MKRLCESDTQEKMIVMHVVVGVGKDLAGAVTFGGRSDFWREIVDR